MSKYIGVDAPYGLFERQDLTALANGTTREFTLTYKASDVNSLLVVQTGYVKKPGADYDLIAGGTKIVFDTAPATGLSLYIVYLGRQISVPATLGNKPSWYKFIADGTQSEFELVNDIGESELPLSQHGLIIFKNSVQQKFDLDYTITSDNKIKFTDTPATLDRIDIHVLGTQRSDISTVDDGSITAPKLADHSVTPDKLNLLFKPYTPTVSTFNSMVSSTFVEEAEYQELYPLVKARVKFTSFLSGTADNKIRVSLPKLNNGSTIIGATAVIRTASTIESGIVQWGSLSAFDVYRPSGVNFALGNHTLELVFEYKSA